MLHFETECGAFSIRLALENAPITAGYFKALAAQGAFDGTSFFRVVAEDNASLRSHTPIEVVQGGLRETDPQPIPPIGHEPTTQTGLRHNKWAVSAARYGPGETYGSFFICMRHEPALDYGGARHPDGLGFAVFGEVVAGFETIKAVFERREPEEMLQDQIVIHKCRLG